jgi:hypothetical protein
MLPGEAHGLHRIRSMASMNFTAEEIARILPKEDIQTRSGQPWRGSTIRKILAQQGTA